MTTFRQKLVNFAAKIYFKFVGSPLSQTENTTAYGGTVSEVEAKLLRRAAAEGAVLLENCDLLPIKGKIALFGRCQVDTFYTGYGSGGNVITPYRTSILEGLRGALPLVEELASAYEAFSATNKENYGGWGAWPRNHAEMPLEKGLVDRARAETDTAVVVLGRAAGEDRDHELKEGSFYLTEAEREMLSVVTGTFPRVAVVLNIGSIVDFSWVKEYPIGALLLLWQGGMETGGALADLLTGKVNPCGRLADTVACEYSDYPSSKNFGNAEFSDYAEDIYVGYRHFETFAKDRVLYPFGYGLSYTKFETSATLLGDKIRFCVKNIGTATGREVVEVYAEKPKGALGSPARELIGFYKTKLLASNGEEQGEIEICERDLASYDESRSAYVLLDGEYGIYVGENVRAAQKIGTVYAKSRILEELSPHGGKEDWKAEILAQIPPTLPKTAKSIDFSDVAAGRATVEEFVSTLSLNELEALAYGALKMNSPLGAAGNAGVMGGVTEGLRERGVPPVTMTDGPSGIRLKYVSALLPIGTLLACTFDPALVEEVYALVGREMKERGSDVLLAPGMNIHRNPLCGRNFEYYSEDPYLTGKIAAAAVRGVQGEGVSACPKHFACNNQEFNRNRNDSRLSERALREIYLRGFEICVKEASPDYIMTSYNLINGVYAHYHFGLVRGILRGEWGYRGCVVTDWWMRKGRSREFKKMKNNALRVRAGVNVLMPGGGYLGKKKQHGGLLKGLNRRGRLTLGELQRNACEVLGAVLKAKKTDKN